MIGDDVVLGDRTAVMAGSYIGRGVRIGGDSLIYPNVVIREDSILGERVIVHAGAVIGDDGFGFARDGETIRKIPQIGNVEIGDDVEIGANSTIDRATTGTTRIGRGTKLDNLVMIAHNVQIGRNWHPLRPGRHLGEHDRGRQRDPGRAGRESSGTSRSATACRSARRGA